ncbi:MAG: hypothetical protein DME26_05920, partial [Verrucomicrobia bacterium]
MNGLEFNKKRDRGDEDFWSTPLPFPLSLRSTFGHHGFDSKSAPGGCGTRQERGQPCPHELDFEIRGHGCPRASVLDCGEGVFGVAAFSRGGSAGGELPSRDLYQSQSGDSSDSVFALQNLAAVRVLDAEQVATRVLKSIRQRIFLLSPPVSFRSQDRTRCSAMNSIETLRTAPQSGPALRRAATFNPQPSSLYSPADRAFTLVVIAIVGLACQGAAQTPKPAYNAIYCFGFSWTDTQGLFPDGSPDFVNNKPQYWQNRASNGPMWPEFLSTNLGLVYNSANNLARGAATSADTLAQANNLQSPSNPERGLYLVWVAGGDFLNATDPTYGSALNWTDESAWNTMIQTVVKNGSNTVERLYAKGARSVVIQNCLDLSLAPGVIRDLGAETNRLAKLKERIARFNADLTAALKNVQQTKPDL